jgi:carboxylesterase type B
MLKQILLITFIHIIRIQSELTEIISISQGQLQGIRNPDADEFLGIPYADCPERFAPVKDAQPWSGILNATTPAPGCYQNCTSFPSACAANISECCFTLNLYRPLQTSSDANLPIMIHFHGGSFTSGASGAPLLNASHLIGLSTNIIIITCNYRLAAFGFWFNTDDINITAPGNVALLDQQKCLQWIQNNVGAFGGDPSNVTLWGQSAGSSSVGFHLQHQLLNVSQPLLFHRVLFQSWPAGIQPRTLIESKLYNQNFAELAGCLDPITVTQCLRNKTADQIVQASTAVEYDVLTYPDKLLTIGLPWQATLDLDSFCLKYNNIDFINRYASQITIPVTWGIDKDEGILFIYEAIPQSVPIPYLTAELIISALWHPQNSDDISNLYNITLINSNLGLVSPIDYHDTISQILADYAFTCPLRNMSRALLLAGNPNVYSYIFDYILKANGTLYGSSNWAPECYNRVCHKSEMPFVFNPSGVSTIQFTNDEQTFAQLIGSYWTNFGKTGDPNKPVSVSPSWNNFTTATNTSLHLTLNASTNWNNYRGQPFCDYWDRLGYIF